jgi:hypothetical protein
MHRGRDLLQHAVARTVSEAIVQQLEIVDIDENEAQRAGVALRALDLAQELRLEVAVVEQLGETVRRRELLEHLVGARQIAVAPRELLVALVETLGHVVERPRQGPHLADRVRLPDPDAGFTGGQPPRALRQIEQRGQAPDRQRVAHSARGEHDGQTGRPNPARQDVGHARGSPCRLDRTQLGQGEQHQCDRHRERGPEDAEAKTRCESAQQPAGAEATRPQSARCVRQGFLPERLRGQFAVGLWPQGYRTSPPGALVESPQPPAAGSLALWAPSDRLHLSSVPPPAGAPKTWPATAPPPPR